MALDYGPPFISPNHIGDDECDRSPLHLLVKHFAEWPYYWFLQMLGEKTILLLRRGANPNAIDHTGDTCLHSIMTCGNVRDVDCVDTLVWYGQIRYQARRRKDVKDLLMLLVLAGADVNAVNDDGESVTDVAEEFGHSQLWREVLDECGFSLNFSYGSAANLPSHTGWSSSVDYKIPSRSALLPDRDATCLTFEGYVAKRKEIFESDISYAEFREDVEAMFRSEEVYEFRGSASRRREVTTFYETDPSYSFRWTDPRTGLLTSCGYQDPRVRDFLAQNGPLDWRSKHVALSKS